MVVRLRKLDSCPHVHYDVNINYMIDGPMVRTWYVHGIYGTWSGHVHACIVYYIHGTYMYMYMYMYTYVV